MTPTRGACVLAAVVAALVAALALSGCGTGGLTEENADIGRGKQLFVESCGSCHALADAGAQGRIGPDLDAAFATLRSDAPGQGFHESTIRDVVRGQIAYPVEDTPTGKPGMPANLVTGEDADAVAAYVAAVAGNTQEGVATIATPSPPPPAVRPGEQGPGRTTTDEGDGSQAAADAKSLFTSAGCGGCHVLADAGGQGTTGPNLDESKPSADESREQIANGGGGMPAFKDQLSEDQIDALAEYIASVAGK